MSEQNKVTQKVAEVLYRCAGNYKCCMIMLIPDGLEIKIGDDVDITKFDITTEEWYDTILPQWMFGYSYDTELDHTLVEVEKIRDRLDQDVCVNDDETYTHEDIE